MDLRCRRCGNTLATLRAGCVVMTHRGREVLVIGDATVSIRCEGCGTVHRAVVHGCEIDLDERPTPA